MRQKDVAAATERCSRRKRRAGGRRVNAMAKLALTHLGRRRRGPHGRRVGKAATERIAIAEGRVVMSAKTLDLVLKGDAKKGDVLGAARIAGIMAAKRTHELIPLCHPLALTKVEVDIAPDAEAAGPRRAARRQGRRARPASRWRRSPPSRSPA